VSQADEDESPLPPDEEAALLTALAAAWRPSELDPGVHQRLLELLLEDPLAEPSEEELIESARLRDALEQGLPHADAGLLSALGAPFRTRQDGAKDAQAVERAVAGALDGADHAPQKRTNVVYAAFGAASAVLAAAAAALLFVGLSRSASAPAASEPSALVKPHSTAVMFADRFETGATTARMDLIASARGRDLRDNRYAAWGVR
jgi:hypothetical protein